MSRRPRWLGLLAMLVLSVLLLLGPPLLGGAASGLLVAAILTLLVLNAAVLLARGRAEVLVTAGLAAPLLTAIWWHVASDAPVVTAAWLAAGAAFFLWTAALLVRAVVVPGPVDRERLAGALAAYLMLGFAGGFLHALVEHAAPGSYAGLAAGPGDAAASGGPASAARLSDLFYFSFTTLTTTGYGDITPASRLARALAMVQALAGLAYLGVVVARLVGRPGTGPADGTA